MVSWLWVLVAGQAGAMLGFFLAALLSAGRMFDEQSEREEER